MSLHKVEPENINKGDILWDCSQGGSYEIEVLTQPVHENNKWTWRARSYDEETDFLITDGLEHYGPRLYTIPCYFPQYSLDFKDKIEDA